MKQILTFTLIVTILASGVFMPFSQAQAQTADSVASSAVADGASCAVSSYITTGVASLVSSLGSKAVNTVADPKVPVTQPGPTEARDGVYLFGARILPGWDAIAYCIGNALITFAANSVTQWINSGFNGNPAFVDNPEKFFADLADQTATSFVAGVVKGTTGVNICQPFRLAVGLSAINSYNSNYNNQSLCTLDRVTQNMEGFLSGSPQYYSNNAMYAATQDRANSYLGNVILASNELNLRLNTQSSLARDMLLQNNGYQNVTECQYTTTQEVGPDGNIHTVKTKIPNSCVVTVTGSDTQKAGQDSRNMANLRLVAATKFDQVITALVNQLIKTALSELLTVTKSSN